MLDEIRATVAPFDLQVLDADDASICAVAENLRILYVNPAWKRFARDNGGLWDDERWIGTSLIDVVPSYLRPFYERLFEGVLTTRVPADHSYECTSARLFRRFRMRVFPTSANGLVMSHAVSLEALHLPTGGHATESRFRDSNGIVTQCCHCRRHKRADLASGQWDWVPAYVETMPSNTSHGLCPMCDAYFYPS